MMRNAESLYSQPQAETVMRANSAKWKSSYSPRAVIRNPEGRATLGSPYSSTRGPMMREATSSAKWDRQYSPPLIESARIRNPESKATLGSPYSSKQGHISAERERQYLLPPIESAKMRNAGSKATWGSLRPDVFSNLPPEHHIPITPIRRQHSNLLPPIGSQVHDVSPARTVRYGKGEAAEKNGSEIAIVTERMTKLGKRQAHQQPRKTEKEEKIKFLRKEKDACRGSETKAYERLHAEHTTASARGQNTGETQPLFRDGQTANSIEEPSFSKEWQFSAEFSTKGGTLQGESSDIILDVPKAAIAVTGTVVIKGAVSTDLDRVHRDLGLSHDERIVSPVIEYFAGQGFVFAKPVKISIPHFAPENSAHDNISVYWFQKEDSGFRKHKLMRHVDVANKECFKSGVFRLPEQGRIEVLINHFCGFVCTHCGESSPQLLLRLYGSPDDGTEVHLFLLVWDKRLEQKDFRIENVVRKSDEDHYIMSKDLNPPLNKDGITRLGARVIFRQQFQNEWTHSLKTDGRPWFPDQQVIDLTVYEPSCRKSSPKRLDWLICRKPGQTANAAFQCFIEVGFLDPSNERFKFLDSQETQILPVRGLKLAENKREVSREVFGDKPPTQCQDTTVGSTTDQNGDVLDEYSVQSRIASGAALGENTVVTKVLKGTPVYELFHAVAAGNCADVYPMQQVIRGVLLLINNKSFAKARANHIKLEDRDGTEMDVGALADLFHQLGFMIFAKDDCTSKGIKDALCYEFHQRDHTKYDCFACVILSHGSDDGILGVDGNPVPLQFLIDVSKGCSCPSLVGKPKLFFVQACQGSFRDPGVVMQNGAEAPEPALGQRTQAPSTKPGNYGRTKPETADTFIALATPPGYCSFRSRVQGSWFIQSLVSVFTQHAHEHRLIDLMTETNGRVSGAETPDVHRNKQQPTWVSTLNRKLYFFPGLVQPRHSRIANGVSNGTV